MLSVCFWGNLILVICTAAYGQECSINIQDDLQSKSPIFLENGKLHVPTGPFLTWNSGEETNVICTGINNFLNNGNSNNGIIKCNSNNKFTLNGKRTNLKTLECTSYSTGDVVKTEKKCLNDGIIYDIGFRTPSNKFIKYIEVCYNVKQASVKYTSHVISGEAIIYSISETRRPSFSVKGIPRQAKPNSSYKKSAQEDRFKMLLGSKATKNYLNSTSFLARGHLTPDKDGIFRSWQYATYFYLNVAPQWQNINAINWLRVENMARKKAADLIDNLEVLTGTSGILTLRNSDNKEVPITLEENEQIVVPKYFWKILKYKNSGIAFVSLNNPFERSKNVCNDICTKYGWSSNEFDILEKGLIYCCTISDLLKVFPNDVPKNLNIKNILAY